MNQQYIISDIATAAYLKLKGIKLVSCSKNIQRFTFVFADPNSICDSLVLEFADSDCRKYDDEIRSLKKILYSKKEQ